MKCAGLWATRRNGRRRKVTNWTPTRHKNWPCSSLGHLRSLPGVETPETEALRCDYRGKRDKLAANYPPKCREMLLFLSNARNATLCSLCVRALRRGLRGLVDAVKVPVTLIRMELWPSAGKSWSFGPDG